MATRRSYRVCQWGALYFGCLTPYLVCLRSYRCPSYPLDDVRGAREAEAALGLKMDGFAVEGDEVVGLAVWPLGKSVGFPSISGYVVGIAACSEFGLVIYFRTFLFLHFGTVFAREVGEVKRSL